MTAQQAVEAAVTMAEMTAAERRSRAEVELIIAAAMIRAIWTAGEILGAAMIAELARQLQRSLPIEADGRRGTRRGQSKARQKRRDQGFHHASIIAVESRDGEQSCRAGASQRGR